MPEFTVETKGRLDAFLAAALGVSRVRAGQMIREGAVTVNGRVMRKPAHVPLPADIVATSADGTPVSETHVEGVDLSLDVLYEDDDCLAVNKPAGIAVHPAPGIKKGEATMLHGAAFLFAKRRIAFVASHVLVHRLDRETTGCLLLAKSPAAHRTLQEQFQERRVRKRYLALVSGVPKHPEAVIDAPIGRSTIHRTKMSVHHAGSTREAKTAYRVLGSAHGASLVECDLHTGRTHQLRVHLTTIGHPILGDPTYNNRESERVSKELEVPGLCLHAWRLVFYAADGQAVELTAPLPKPFRDVALRAEIALPRQ